MDEGYYMALAKVENGSGWRAFNRSKRFIRKSSYKSANNRAFYAIE